METISGLSELAKMGGEGGGLSAWMLMGGIVFSGIGFVAFIYGKKQSLFFPMLIGGALLAFPYFVHNMIAFFSVGLALTISLFIFRG